MYLVIPHAMFALPQVDVAWYEPSQVVVPPLYVTPSGAGQAIAPSSGHS